MLTAIQLFSTGSPTSRLVHGNPVRLVRGPRGPIAVCSAGRIVAYHLHVPGRTWLYLFRTAAEITADLAEIPGVYPAVNLLLVTRHPPAVKRVSFAFRMLATQQRDIDTLSDHFWLRLSGVVSSRRQLAPSVVLDLLGQEPR